MKLIFLLLAKLPFKVNKYLGLFIGFILNFGGESKNITRQNIDLCFPKLSDIEKKILVKKSLTELGKAIAESFYIWGNSFTKSAKLVSKINGLDNLKTDKAIILLTPHFGSFEIVGGILSLHKPLCVLYKPAKNKILDGLIFKSRNKGDMSVVPTTIKGIASLSKVLKGGGMIGILPDQYSQHGSINSDFFGIATKATTLLSKLANKYNVKVILTYAIRNKNSYELFLQEVDIKADDLQISVNKVNQVIEDLVKKYPEQYIWNYKKFRETHNYN